MPSVIIPARIACRDIVKHPWRSVVAVLFFTLPIAVVTLLGFMGNNEHNYADLHRSDIVLSQEGTGTDLERIRKVFPDEKLRAEESTLATVRSGSTTAYIRTKYVSDGPDTFTIPQDMAHVLGIHEGNTIEVQAPWEQAPRTVTMKLGNDQPSLRLSVPVDKIVSAEFPTPVSWSSANPNLDFRNDDVQAYPAAGPHPGSLTPVLSAVQGHSAFDNASLVSLGLLALIVLAVMVSPIFAVAARRQQHSMRVLSINGAVPAQLRWVLYMEALAISAVGIVLGLVLGVAGFLVLFNGAAGTSTVPPLDLLALTVGSSLFCALVAAVIPAVSAARSRPTTEVRLRWRWPMAIGPVIVVCGLLLGILGSRWATVGYGIFGIGAVSSTPALLWLLARSSAWGPVSLRLALRDLFRQVHRTGPAIAAILGLSFVLGTISLGGPYEYKQDDTSPIIAATANVYAAESAPIEKEVRELSQALGGVPPMYVYRDIDKDTVVIDPAQLSQYQRYRDAEAEKWENNQVFAHDAQLEEPQYEAKTVKERKRRRIYLDHVLFFPERSLTLRQEFMARHASHNFISVSFLPDRVDRLWNHYLIPLIMLSVSCLVVMILLAVLSVGETRTDLSTMWTVGAPQRLLARISAMQSLLIALIGVVSGFVASLISYFTMSSIAPMTIPWLLWLVLIIVVPLLGWASGGATAAVSHRKHLRRR
ncbi:FtsX-like permease family protein [Corynebacterium kroppenstedtii]|uniref:FtsX-like permease family protein n=1 Tax=Corynebacterium sp. PCR 32 TaxID=3351342 RepID=UPI0030972C78